MQILVILHQFLFLFCLIVCLLTLNVLPLHFKSFSHINDKHLNFFSPQVHVSMDHKLPYIIEADDAEHEEDVGHSRQRRVPLLQAVGSSPVHQPRLSTLLGEELRHIRALRLCRSPVQGGRGRSPSPHAFTSEELSLSPLPSLNTDADSNCRPAKLLMPSLPCVSPLNLSPR